MEFEAYLERIAYNGPLERSAETLRHLHRAHMLSVPFENLDIPLGTPIVLSLPALYDKVVRRRRGGFCYELNGLFAWLLEQLGFEVVLLSARVVKDDQPGPEFDHMVLQIPIEGGLIADVGFGDSFLEALPLDLEKPNVQPGGPYRLVRSESGVLLERGCETEWDPQYIFSMAPRKIDDFNAMCQFHQTSPNSPFTQKTVCSMATPDGRVTLSNDRLIVTNTTGRKELEISNEYEYEALLKKHFGIDLEDGSPVDSLMVSYTPSL